MRRNVSDVLVQSMKVAILLYGMFRDPRTSAFWSCMLPRGDVFVFATFTRTPRTTRSQDKDVDANITFTGTARAAYWSVIDQEVYDQQINLSELVRNVTDPFDRSQNKSSLRRARSVSAAKPL